MRPEVSVEIRAALPRDPAWLSPGERERLDAMRLPRRRNEFRRGRWLAKRMLARALGLATDFDTLRELEIGADERGAPRPRRRGEPVDCDLSISHRKGAALCAMAPRGARVGCDIEWVEPRSVAFERHMLNAEERTWLETLAPADRARGANLVWSIKESAVKALGTGLDVDVRTLRLRLDDAGRCFEVDVPGVPAPLVGRIGHLRDFVWAVASQRRLVAEAFRLESGAAHRRTEPRLLDSIGQA